MSRILMVVGSRREGNCYYLAQNLKNIFDKSRISSDIIIPGNQKIYLCTGCMDCDKSGKCDFNDDMKSNIDKVNNSEIIIFITPTRWNTMSGDLKIFIDRLNPLYSEKKLKDKKMIVLVIGSKKRSEYSTDGALTSLGSFIESAESNLIYKEFFDNCLNYPDILNYTDKINKTANEIINLIE